MTKFGRLGRLAASASAVALLGVGLLGSAASAELSPGNIDPEQSGSLIIHKYAGYTGSDRDDGHPNDDVDGTPLEGVEFTIYPIVDADGDPIDLTTPDGWDLIEGLTAADVPDGLPTGYVLGTPYTVTTLDDGSVTQALPFGLYYVEETGSGDNLIVSKVVPFLVTVPYPSDGAWIYEVHVYPKNIVDANKPMKAVENPAPGYVPGDTVTWTVTKTLPMLQEGESFSSLVFKDTFDARLTITAGDVSVTADGTALTAVDDYTVDVNGQEVTVTFTEAGLGKLAGNKDVVVTYETTVTGDLSLDELGRIPNMASVVLNDVSQNTNEVAVYYGAIQVEKKNEQGAPLAGAEFDVYATVDGERVKLNADPLVTNAEGKFDTPFWVWVGVEADASMEYILVETKAPAGYITPEGEAAESTVTVKAGEEEIVFTAEVTNMQHKGPDLPLTGAQGTLLLTLIGAGLIGAGAAAVGIRRARTNR